MTRDTPLKILILSDLHLGHPGPPDPEARLRRALDDIAAHHADAALAVLTGDLTHHGRPAEYARLRGLLTALPCPVLPLPGNHDDRKALLAAFPEAPRTAEGHVQGVRTLGGMRIVTLDTRDDPPFPAGPDAGALCAARLRWLDRVLSAEPDRPALLFAHHPPVATGIPGMDRIGLGDSRHLLDLLARHPRVGGLICGHQHRAAAGRAGGLAWWVMESVWCQLDLNLTPEGKNRFDPQAPGAYGILLLRPDGQGFALHRRHLPPA